MLWTSKCIMIFESQFGAQMTGIDYILYRASELEFLIYISIYVFSIHFINFIHSAYSLLCIYIVCAIRGKRY